MTNDFSTPASLNRKARVLFLCGENSGRSQMAEGFTRAAAPDSVEVFSAGVEERPVNPLAVKVMSELGIDISSQRSKPASALTTESFDYVITLCDRAHEPCPSWPGVREAVVWSFEDPAAADADSERLPKFRAVATGLKQRISLFLLSTRLARRN